MSAAFRWRVAFALSVSLALPGCAVLAGKLTGGLAADLSGAILESDDPEVVRDGAPAYLIMLDALLRRGGRSPDLLRSAAALNGAYATAFVRDEARRRAFADKAFDLAQRAACIDVEWTCEARTMAFEALELRTAFAVGAGRACRLCVGDRLGGLDPGPTRTTGTPLPTSAASSR